jgi:hypothetical protein
LGEAALISEQPAKLIMVVAEQSSLLIVRSHPERGRMRGNRTAQALYALVRATADEGLEGATARAQRVVAILV